MSVVSRVVKVVCMWAHLSGPPDETDQLQVIWASSHDGDATPFQPDAVQLLISALQNEFGYPPALKVQLIPNDFFPPGNIKTVADLETVVGGMPAP
jgi:hypothetical protein